MPWPPWRLNRGAVVTRGAFFEPLALHGSIFFVFWSPRNLIEKSAFFAFFQNRQKRRINRSRAPPGSILDYFPWLLGAILASIFHCFFEWPKVKKNVCFSILFNGFRPSKTIDFPIVFSLIFHVFSKPLPGTVFRGSQHRTFLKSWILVPFPIFMVFKKAPFGHHVQTKSSQNRTRPKAWDVFFATLLFKKP